MERLSQEQLQALDIHLLEWYHQQADTRQKDLVRVEHTITDRGYTLLAVYFAILSAAVGYVLTHLHIVTDAALTYGCLSVIIFTSISIYYIYLVIRPHSYHTPGRKPDEMEIPGYIAYFISHQVSGDNQRKQILGDELVVLQNKIDLQEEKNDIRTTFIRYSLYFMLAGASIGVSLFLAAAFIL